MAAVSKQPTKTELLTLQAPAESQVKDRGSRFLGFAEPLASRDELAPLLQRYRHRFADATHVCHAYRFGPDMHASDDGEPAHSAGSPILRQIQAHNLTHVAVVVVRYYGGTKLGVPGLIQAYGAAAKAALEAGTFMPFVPMQRVALRCAINEADSLLRQLKAVNPQQLQKHFDSDCKIEFFVRQDDYPLVASRFADYLADG